MYILITDPANIFFLTGISVNSGILLIDSGKLRLYTYILALEKPINREQNYDFKVIFGSPGNIRAKVLRGIPAGTVISTDQPEFFYDFQKSYNFKKYKTIFLKRSIKNEQEIEMIKRAIEISEKAFLYSLKIIREGISELDLKAEIEYNMLKFGGTGTAFDTITAFSENASLPHYTPGSDRLLKNGDTILVDWGSRYNGYCADITRTILFGKCRPLIKTWVDTVRRASDAIFKQIQNGERQIFMLNKIYKTWISRKYLKHSLGHGLGLDVHESPFFTRKTKLHPGNVITIEPGAYSLNEFGVRIEDDVYITENSIEKLTNLSKTIVL